MKKTPVSNKRAYQRPAMRVVNIAASQMLCASAPDAMFLLNNDFVIVDEENQW